MDRDGEGEREREKERGIEEEEKVQGSKRMSPAGEGREEAVRVSTSFDVFLSRPCPFVGLSPIHRIVCNACVSIQLGTLLQAKRLFYSWETGRGFRTATLY